MRNRRATRSCFTPPSWRLQQAAAVLAMLMLSASCTRQPPPCPAPWAGHGEATFYAVEGVTACAIAPHTGLTAAISDEDYDGSIHCGECLEVAGPERSVIVRITDRCPACANGGVDLSPQAFNAIADPEQGRVDISWRRVACPLSGPLAFRFQGSNPSYLKLQVLNHRYGIATVDLVDADSGNRVSMQRSSDNHFVLSPTDSVDGGMRFRITATTGESLVQNIAEIDNSGRTAGTSNFSTCTPGDAQ